MDGRGKGDIALVYAPEAYSSSGAQGQVWGRQSAGGGFLRALAETRPERVLCFTHPPGAADDLRAALARDGSPHTAVDWVSLHNLDAMSGPGLLYNPDPMVDGVAWLRSAAAQASAWSICGIVHAVSTHNAMSAIAGWLSAPLHPWDAVVCTSEAVHDAVMRVLAAQADFLAERLGATRLSPPRLPVIPLGVHAADFAFTAGDRAEARVALGLAPDEVAALYVGRLSPFSKAHPAPMYLALEACAAAMPAGRGELVLVEAGWFESDADRDAYEADAAMLCPSVRRIAVDGRDATARQRAWAGADFFVSLSDSVQESFGLTPVEAMAAGLPVVVSDWNGYRDTVRDGVDGFRVPTWAPQPGRGQFIADRYALHIDDHAGFLAATGCCVAVDVFAAAAACARLAGDEGLRRRMGEAGRAHVARTFDWKVIFARYRALWTELGEIRRAGAGATPLRARTRPDRPDPFTMFAGYPTITLAAETLVRRASDIDAPTMIVLRDLDTMRLASAFIPDAALIESILRETDGTSSCTFSHLCRRLGQPALRVAPALLWLAKVAGVRLSPPKGVRNQ